jgi:hypothetical protein
MTVYAVGLLDISVCALFALNPSWTPYGRVTRAHRGRKDEKTLDDYK